MTPAKPTRPKRCIGRRNQPAKLAAPWPTEKPSRSNRRVKRKWRKKPR